MSTATIQWDHWRSFIAVAELGSLSAAARGLGLAQPTVSRHIDLLEQAVGAALFLRSPQGLAMSDLGRQLLPEARAMAASAAALERTASAPRDAACGVVRVTASEAVGAEILPGVLAPLLAEHPGLEVELVLSNRNEDLLHRAADLAVRMVRPTQAGLIARRVADLRIGLFAHAAYLAARGTPRTVPELAGHVLIGPDRDSAQLNAIRAGMGIGAMQAGLAHAAPELRPVLPGSIAFELECWLAMHEDLRSTARMRMVLDHLAAHLPEALRVGRPA